MMVYADTVYRHLFHDARKFMKISCSCVASLLVLGMRTSAILFPKKHCIILYYISREL